MTGILSNTSRACRTSKTAGEILAALNKTLQAHPECQGLKVLKLTFLENSHGLANWDAEFATDDGTAISAECKRVFISAKQSVQKCFDLAGRGRPRLLSRQPVRAQAAR